MIYDTVLYHNEADVLALRFATLAPVPDLIHVVVTADHAFSGEPLDVDALKAQVRAAGLRARVPAERVAHVHFALGPAFPHRWAAEWALRNACWQALRSAPRPPAWSDLVVLADCDEIPRPEYLPAIAHDMQQIGRHEWFALGLSLRTFYYTPEIEADEASACVALRYNGLDEGAWTPQSIRNVRLLLPQVHQGGWHLSHHGGVARMRETLTRYAHAEFDTDAHHEALPERAARLADPLGRDQVFTRVPLDESMPLPLRMAPGEWADLLRPDGIPTA